MIYFSVILVCKRYFFEHCCTKTGAFVSSAFSHCVAPLFETQCSYVEATVDQFLSWTQGQPVTDVGPFSEYSYSEFWAYADYKYIAMLFEDQPFMFEVITLLLHVSL